MPSESLAKKKELSFYEGLQPIAASIKEGVLLLRLTIALIQPPICLDYSAHNID